MRFTVGFLGDAGVGKTTLLNRIRTGEFTKVYIPTLSTEISLLTFHTTHGVVELEIHEYGGQRVKDPHLSNLTEDGFVIMFDLTNRSTYRSIKSYLEYIPKKTDVSIVGNKCDVVTRQPLFGLNYPRISAKSNTDHTILFLHLVQHFVGDEKLQFIEAPAIGPVEVTV